MASRNTPPEGTFDRGSGARRPGQVRRFSFWTAFALLCLSFRFCYWELTALGANETRSWRLAAFLDHLELAPVAAADGPATGAALAQLERSTLVGAMVVTVLLGVAALLNSRWSVLLALPALGFPWVVYGDLRGALSLLGCQMSRIPESSCTWQPRLLGDQRFGEWIFGSQPGPGFWLAAGATLAVFCGMFLWLPSLARKICD